MSRYEHRGGAEVAELTSQATAGDVTIEIDSANGWPDSNFFAVIDRGLSTEEKILVTTRTGTSLGGVLRGQDDTIAYPHDSAAKIEHVFTALEADAANAHVEASGGVHGLAPGVAPASQQDVFSLGNDFTALEAQLTAEVGQKDNEIQSLQTSLSNLTARVSLLEGSAPGSGDTAGLVDPAIVSRIGAHAALTRQNFNISDQVRWLDLSAGSLAQTGTSLFSVTAGGVRVPWDGVYKTDIHYRFEGDSTFTERLELALGQGANGTEAQPFAFMVKRQDQSPLGTGSYEGVGSGRLSYMDAGDLVKVRHTIISGSKGVNYKFIRLSVAYIGPGGGPSTQ